MSIWIMATGYTCMRHLLCAINLIFWILGTCMLSIGIWLSVSYDSYARILPSYHVLSADNLAIIAGGMTFLIAFCGCCGAWFQSKCLLTCYLVAIVLVMILEIGAGTVAFAFRRTLGDTFRQELLDGIEQRYVLDDRNGMAATWDQIQMRFECCGVSNYTDWYKIKAWPEQDWVPQSCCIPTPIHDTNNETSSVTTLASFANEIIADEEIEELHSSTNGHSCGRSPDDVIRYRRHGCFTKIRSFVLKNLHIVGITSIAAAFIQFFVIVGALLIVCTMDYKKQNRPIMNHNSRPTYNRVPTL